MPQAYLLKGDFVECCDCFTVCPCWVSDLPDEDHCSGLYVWSFAEGSYIGNQDNSVAGMKVAAATYHAVRQGGQAFFYIDVNGGDPSMVDTLYQIFSDQSADHDLKGLANLLGLYLGHKPARIDANFGAKDFDVSVDTEGGHIATAKGEEKVFTNQQEPMTLRDTALDTKLGIRENAVVVQKMGALTVDVAALPGGPLNFLGRSGMRSKFRYEFTAAALAKAERRADKASQESKAAAKADRAIKGR
ncbi:DUF1326 domain-containing protein [Novosphingobium sp. B 225]|uniref:DUF1326 domain-containing protein n=1 Tax=Novosphingobium sp. B 225 TaxID=1961849 RepID=UPI000B4C1F61|nr:DUF1326 domain-containing protein [Novosphingobium sp. B 225]